jgi:S-adenosylmethionine:tRNA ribosyltransferase-isomerase
MHRGSGQVEHRQFSDLPDYLRAGDVLVLNNSRVIPARVRGHNLKSGGQFEILMLEENRLNDWWVMLRPGKRARKGTQIVLRGSPNQTQVIVATVADVNTEGHRRLVFSGVPNIGEALEHIGEVPLPPYINRSQTGATEEDRTRYQTVYAEAEGSVAAPTAGLHFTKAMLGRLRTQGVQICFVTLHVGLGTFAPVKSETVANHVMHEERYEISEPTALAINTAKAEGRRVFAVGTTTTRLLQSAALVPDSAKVMGSIAPGRSRTRIFIYPPYRFKNVDGLLTNFHLPRSTLLMLVSAFAAPGETRGREMVLAAYGEAISRRYRFFSYGDAMLLI